MPYVMKAEIDRPVKVGDAVIAAVAKGGYMHFVIEAPMSMRIEKLDDGTVLEEWRRMVYEPRGVKPKASSVYDKAMLETLLKGAKACSSANPSV